MIDKKSKEYKQGVKDGIKFTCDHLIETSQQFRRDMLELIKMAEINNGKKN